MATFNYDPRTAAVNAFQPSMLELEKFRNGQAKAYFDAAMAVDTQNRLNALGSDTLENSAVSRRVNNANAMQRELLNGTLLRSTSIYNDALDDPITRDQATQALRDQQSTRLLQGMIQNEQVGLVSVNKQSGAPEYPDGSDATGISPFGSGFLNGYQKRRAADYTFERMVPTVAGVAVDTSTTPVNGAPVAGSPLYGSDPKALRTSTQQLADIVRNSAIAQRYGSNGVPVTGVPPAYIPDGVGPGARAVEQGYPETVVQRYGGPPRVAATPTYQATLNPRVRDLQVQKTAIDMQLQSMQADYAIANDPTVSLPPAQKQAFMREYNDLLKRSRETDALLGAEAQIDTVGDAARGVRYIFDGIKSGIAGIKPTLDEGLRQRGVTQQPSLSRDYTK